MDAGPDRCPDEWADDIDPQVRPAAASKQGRPKGGAKTNGGIEGTSRDRPSSKNCGHDGEPNGQAVEGIALGRFCRSYSEHNQHQCGCEHDLNCERLEGLHLGSRM